MNVSVGRVKWYGGFNHKKNTENKFGFIEDVSGVDVFLHEKAWEENVAPMKDQIVVYTLDANKRKPAAHQARIFRFRAKEDFYLLNDIFLTESLSRTAQPLHETQLSQVKPFLRDTMFKALDWGLSKYSKDLLEACVEVVGKGTLCTLLASQTHWEQNLDTLSAQGLVDPLRDISLDLLPSSYISRNSSEVAGYLLSLDVQDAGHWAQAMLDRVYGGLLCFVLLARFVEADKRSLSLLDQFVSSIYSGKLVMPDYLKQYIDTHIKPNGGVIKDAVVGPTFSYYQFKHYLNGRDLKFINLYSQSPTLQERTDTFILGEIFALVVAGNPVDSIYSVFMGRLWQAISTGKIDITRDKERILELFPSCYTMPHGLSCEAVYWPKQKIFLCRGQVCHSPQVIPHTNRSYLEYSIYDWFSHYGINYLSHGQPSNRDFPIKLAGYFNRLHEIFEVIHCRECSSLMLPDMRYARVEHSIIQNGEFVKKDMAPAYRLTVFKCPNEACVEHGKSHYINHCRGFDCHQLIDDRDIKTKCDSGLYICNGCGSCCEDHAKSNPVGLCPDCASELLLFETREYNQIMKRHDRFVKCSNEYCGFEIPTKKLNKRFYQPSCGLVIKAASGGYEQGRGDLDDVPF